MAEILLNDVENKLEDAKKQIGNLERLPEGSNEPEPDKLKTFSSLLRCPITKNVMVDPVVGADDHTHERSAIEDVFSQAPSDQEARSPVTGDILSDRRLALNVDILA
mmetsp:Transcript_9967/g.23062  ORF Transcript_9967/g.23062 Transcript_9967/m.23062 type:complete len:107 (+) Transcript_9967:496-816(+)